MKKCILLVLSCSYVTILFAQSETMQLHKFSLKAGIGYSAMNFNAGEPAPATPVQNTWKPGLQIGIAFEAPLDRVFSFQPEYLYSYMQGQDERTKAGYKLQYFSLPVLLRITVSDKLAFVAGPAFDMLIGAKQNINGVPTGITHDTEERSISAVAGLTLTITPSLYIDARYLQGLNHVGLGQRSAVTEFKWLNTQVGLGFRL